MGIFDYGSPLGMALASLMGSPSGQNMPPAQGLDLDPNQPTRGILESRNQPPPLASNSGYYGSSQPQQPAQLESRNQPAPLADNSGYYSGPPQDSFGPAVPPNFATPSMDPAIPPGQAGLPMARPMPSQDLSYSLTPHGGYRDDVEAGIAPRQVPQDLASAVAPPPPASCGHGVTQQKSRQRRSMKNALHFVGFKDDRVHNARRVFGQPDFWHRIFDRRGPWLLLARRPPGRRSSRRGPRRRTPRRRRATGSPRQSGAL
jgi:hypothetical protein